MNFLAFQHLLHLIWPPIHRVLANDRTWNVVSAIAALGATWLAFETVRDATESQREERAAKRPYFISDAPQFRVVGGLEGEQRTMVPEISIRNIGGRPAVGVVMYIYVFYEINGKQATEVEFKTPANDVPPSGGISFNSRPFSFPAADPSIQLLVDLRYRDMATSEIYNQRWHYSHFRRGPYKNIERMEDAQASEADVMDVRAHRLGVNKPFPFNAPP